MWVERSGGIEYEEVHVLVNTLTGEELDLQVDSDGTVSTLKLRVQESWGYPPEAQQLLLQSEIEEDSRLLKTLPRPLALALVILPFDKCKALLHAARKGHEAAIRRLLCNAASDGQERSSMLRATSGLQQRTPLHVAADRGHRSACKALLEAAQSSEESSGLLTAADDMNSTPLHLAAQSDQDHVCRTLIAALPNVKFCGEMLVAKNNSGWMPLHAAAYEGSSDACQALLEAAPTPEVRCEMLLAADPLGRMALHLAAERSVERACQVCPMRGGPCVLLDVAPSVGVRGKMMAATDWSGKTAVQVAEGACRYFLQSQ